MVPVSGEADPFAPGDPQAFIDRPGFRARVEPSVDRAHDLAHDIVGDAQIAADVVHMVVDSLWSRRDELTDDDLQLESILLATRAAALDRRNAPSVVAPAPAAGIDQPSSASRHRVDMAQAGSAVLGADDMSALDLHLRNGIGADTLASALGVSADDAPPRLARAAVASRRGARGIHAVARWRPGLRRAGRNTA